jgi:hypothetical protein
MKLYYTLVQPFGEDLQKDLVYYLAEREIQYDMGADFADDLAPFGFKVTSATHGDRLLKKVIVLIEEHELSAILLSVDHVHVIRNRGGVEFKNTMRRMFKWFLK